MKESQKLFKQASDLFEQAKTAYSTGTNNADTLKAEAEAMLKRAENVKVIEDQQAALTAPIMDVALPADGSGTTIVTPPASKPDIAKAVYQTRFGEPDSAVKAVLVDLHGPNYEQKRWNQQKAFNSYLRRYDRAPSNEDDLILREVILTPEYAGKAIKEGWEVAYLKSTMVEAIDSLGGYVVPVDFQNRVIERLMGLVVMRGRAFGMNTSRDRVQIPKATGGDGQYTSAVRVTWVDETPTAGTAETNLTFGMEEIPVHTAMAETPLSRNLVEDAAVNLVDYLARKFAEAAAVDEDNQFLTGNGVGKPQGILAGAAPVTGITAVNSGSASALTFDGLIALTYGIDAQYRQNAVWIAEKATYRAIAQLKDGNGQYLWRDMFGQNTGVGGAGTQRQLLGYPSLEQEVMPTIASSAYPIVFGDLTGYTIVDRIGMTVERYLDSATARQNLVYYVMRRRLGGQVTEPWRLAAQLVSA